MALASSSPPAHAGFFHRGAALVGDIDERDALGGVEGEVFGTGFHDILTRSGHRHRSFGNPPVRFGRRVQPVGVLQFEPDFRAGTECQTDLLGSLHGNALVPVDDLVDGLQWPAEHAREIALRPAAGMQFFAQEFAGREDLGGFTVIGHFSLRLDPPFAALGEEMAGVIEEDLHRLGFAVAAGEEF